MLDIREAVRRGAKLLESGSAMREKYGAVMGRDELADRLGIADWVNDPNRSQSRLSLNVPSTDGQTGYNVQVDWPLNASDDQDVRFEVNGLSRGQTSDYRGIPKGVTYSSPSAQGAYERRVIAQVVQPLPGTQDLAGIVQDIKVVNDVRGKYALGNSEHFSITRDETGKVEFGRDSAFRRDYETQAMNYPSDAQEAAIYGMGRIIADAKAGKPLNTGNLATLQVNPERLHSKAPQPRPTVVA